MTAPLVTAGLFSFQHGLSAGGISIKFRHMLKQFAKDMVPAPVWGALHDWKHKERTFWSWRQACRSAGSYDNDAVTRFRWAREAGQPMVPISETHPLVAAIQRLGRTSLAITDFGGGPGTIAKSIRARFPDAMITIVEHPGMVATAPLDVGGIIWTTAPPNQCDVFFTSGTLQYLDKPYRTLRKGFASAAGAVVLARNSFAKKEIIRVQRCPLFDNGDGDIPSGFSNSEICYPHRTIKEEMVMRIARQEGFVLVAATPENSGVLPFRDLVYGKDLLFLRR